MLFLLIIITSISSSFFCFFLTSAGVSPLLSLLFSALSSLLFFSLFSSVFSLLFSSKFSSLFSSSFRLTNLGNAFKNSVSTELHSPSSPLVFSKTVMSNFPSFYWRTLKATIFSSSSVVFVRILLAISLATFMALFPFDILANFNAFSRSYTSSTCLSLL